MRPYFVGALILIAVVACTQATGPGDGAVSVRAIGHEVQLTNHSTEQLFSFVIDRQAAAYTDWGPCGDPTRCGGIAPGAVRGVPYSSIVGYTLTSREAIVYWWRMVPDGATGFRADSVRGIVVSL